VIGTDYPFPWTKTAVNHILATLGLSDGERVVILEETAGHCQLNGVEVSFRSPLG